MNSSAIVQLCKASKLLEITVYLIDNCYSVSSELQKVLTFRVANLPDIEGWFCKLSSLLLDF